MGENLTTANIDVLRPGEQKTGLTPKYYNTVFGKTAARNIQSGEGITEEDVEEDIEK
jgi:N-acetylneuraminate synthase